MGGAERNSCWLWYKIGRKKAGHLELMRGDLATTADPPTKGRQRSKVETPRGGRTPSDDHMGP